ncbi:NupC/NupG family nucleoside CNT transporter [Phenylobacterium sp.]|uniref:NupC/NupG family nucleoside CNT transporter n=1 Tax=Phenylobacterium sp. TaxID=1871053 RepID=UPI00272F0529|nr:nucleoside transporter C-terminal domain-containing protein [Phenylobacterium sp.]MDP1616968.1 nucleoside transporter C-terminal domain-containing protein [Phenylobacterium sp.]MDP1986412.1 nucleoside transporter C-terminal domain-containing protein [Phenylobacterium sp.]
MFRPENAQSLLGLVLVLVVCWALSEDRSRFPWRLALGALTVQILLVLALFGLPGARSVVRGINAGVDGLAAATAEGTRFVFGYMAGGAQPYPVTDPGALFVFAFQVLPLILVISALSALLWHWKILKWITQGFGFVFQKTMGLGGASALAVAVNIFLGMIESPIVIRAYLDKLTRSEVFLMIVVGLATVAGSTMVAYATILREVLPNAAAHVLVASIVSAPAGVLLARIIVPEKKGQGGYFADYGSLLKYDSSIDAISKGTMDGLTVALNISAILIVFVSFVAIGNGLLSAFPDVMGGPLTIERVLGVVFSPLAWLIGVPWSEAPQAGYLLGVKLMLTEFIAFIQLGGVPAEAMSERTRMIMTYALCGFANIGSVGITVTGMGVLMPERRAEIIGMVWKALLAGFLATCMTAAVVGAMPRELFGL